MIEFKGKFDINAQKSLYKRSFKAASIFILIFSIVVLLIGICGVIWGEDTEDFNMAIYLICIAVLFYPLFCGIYFLLRKFAAPTSNLMTDQTEQQFQFFEDRFMCSQVKGEEFNDFMQAKYSVLFRVVETKEQYFLYLTRTQCLVVNKADLVSGSIEALNEILSAALAEKFKKLK